jgi:glycerol-3-phosphate acyltransferase PlsY
MIAVFLVVVALFRYVSLGSIVAAAIFPLAAHLLGEDHGQASVLACMAAASLLIIAKHHANIGRLLTGSEHKFRQNRT